MKPGDTFNTDMASFLDPLVGRLVTMEVDGEPVKVRIKEFHISEQLVSVQVVSNTTKE